MAADTPDTQETQKPHASGPDTWQGDACSLVDAFRSGERSPVEELEVAISAIEASDLNAFAHLDFEGARAKAKTADVSLPFGGVPFGIKELEQVEGWPFTEASLIFKDRMGTQDTTMVSRIRASGVVPVGSTTASEFGGLNVSVTKINGVTGNGWDGTRTAGGSSGGSAAAVSGGLIPLACGGDGGGSIRIPAGYNGLVGMKGTFGRIPRGPHTSLTPHTVVLGCLARSIRDAARILGANSFHSLPIVDGDKLVGLVTSTDLISASEATRASARRRSTSASWSPSGTSATSRSRASLSSSLPTTWTFFTCSVAEKKTSQIEVPTSATTATRAST